MPATVKNKVCLIVHDGWGLADATKGNAITSAETPNMDKIAAEHSHRSLAAHGIAVGLSEGLMGNSEVGHLNIGAGRIVWQDIVKIDVSIKKKQFQKSPKILESFNRAKDGNGRLHLLGLVSDGGVHSHIHHLRALLETAKAVGVPYTYIHFFGDGRDVDQKSAKRYLADLDKFTSDEKYGELSTVVGRYYAMDRDKKWERLKVAVDAMTLGEGEKLSLKDVEAKVDASYEEGVFDEFLKPIVVNGSQGRIKEGDTLFFFNYRADRMRQLATVFGVKDQPADVQIPKDLHITTMSRYSADFTFNVAFPPTPMTNVLAEWLSAHDVKQVHIAESEKKAHVTFFFNGGRDEPFPGEERVEVKSPNVATYDLQPEMSAQGVADKVAEFVKKGEHEFVLCNFAPPDMVGHSGKLGPAIQAITATDRAVGTVYAACQEAGYLLLITADHGNAEQMLNLETGEAHTAHTTNPVPLLMSGDPKVFRFTQDRTGGLAGKKEGEGDAEEEEEGALCDVAPTILELLGLPKPEEMSGRSLIAKFD